MSWRPEAAMCLRNSSSTCVAAGGVLAGGRADLDADRLAGGPLPERLFGLLDQDVESLGNFGVHENLLQGMARLAMTKTEEDKFSPVVDARQGFRGTHPLAKPHPDG